MTDALSNRSASTRLARHSGSPERVALVAIAVLVLAGWVALVIEARRSGSGIDAFIGALCRPVALDRAADVSAVLRDFAIAAALWVAMSFAMMLPTAAPMALSYAERATRGEFGTKPASPLVLIAGYLTIWTGVAFVAALLQTAGAFAMARVGLSPGVTAILAGVAMAGAGLYQFTDYKLACLSICRHPMDAAVQGSAGRTAAIYRLGLAQGVACLGCCWAMMGLMLVAGTMNLAWMAAFAILMTAEKTTQGVWLPRAIGAGLMIAGFAAATGFGGFAALGRLILG